MQQWASLLVFEKALLSFKLLFYLDASLIFTKSEELVSPHITLYNVLTLNSVVKVFENLIL